MTNQFVPRVDPNHPHYSFPKVRVAEVAGGTAAECAAVCCCPCSLVNLLVLAVYKLPAALFQKALRRKRLRRRVAAPARRCSYEEKEVGIQGLNSLITVVNGKLELREADEAVVEMDKEMLERFRRGGGFWRSSSRESEV